MTAGGSRTPRFRILMATFDGAAFLEEQLASIAGQSEGVIDVTVSDDGSTDATPAILSAAAKGWTRGQFQLCEGPRAGVSENFRALILNAAPDADFYAFCDQDDVWDADKLEKAHRRLSALPAGEPALYCGATRMIDAKGRPLGLSPLMRRPPAFSNAIVQSIAGGNTMVLNRAALQLLRKASRDVRFVLHDWWSYIVVAGAGGTVIYDPEPRVSYRQHGANLIGSNRGVAAQLSRARLLLRGGWSDWLDTNLAALSTHRDLLAPDNRQVLDEFAALRKERNPLRRVLRLRSLQIHRQRMAGDVLMAAVLALSRF